MGSIGSEMKEGGRDEREGISTASWLGREGERERGGREEFRLAVGEGKRRERKGEWKGNKCCV